MFLIKMFVVIGVVEIPNAFTFQLTFAIVGLVHLLTLPLLDNFQLIKDSKLLLRYSKTSDLLRRILDNWENRLYYYIFNMVNKFIFFISKLIIFFKVVPWNTLIFCRNYNNQRRNLERNWINYDSYYNSYMNHIIKCLIQMTSYINRTLNTTSSFVTKLTKQKLKKLKIIQDRLLFSSSSNRDPFQVNKLINKNTNK